MASTKTVVDVLNEIVPKLSGLSGQGIMDTLASQGLSVVFKSPSYQGVPIIRGDLTLMAGENRTTWKQSPVALTVTQYRVVDMLSASPGVQFSYRAIYDVVQSPGFIAGDERGFETNVRTTVKRIRQAFKDVDPKFNQLENAFKFGYCWNSY